MIALKQDDLNVAQLLVRKIPESVMDGIRSAASAEGVSVEEFARRALQNQADQRKRWTEFVEWSREFTGAQHELRHPFPGTTQLIRSERRR
jgi:hypothetical protein